MAIEVMNALYLETKLLEKIVIFTNQVKLKEQNCFFEQKKINMDAVFIKVSIFDKPDIYVQLIL